MLICARCGEHCHRFRWFSELRRQGARGEWRSWERDAENPRLYWTRHCWPSCRANNVFTLFEQVEGFILAAAPQEAHPLIRHWLETLRRAVWLALGDAEECD